MKIERAGTIALWIIALVLAYEVLVDKEYLDIWWNVHITYPKEKKAKEKARFQNAKNWCDPKSKKGDYKYHEGGYFIHPDGRPQYIAGESGRKLYHSQGEESCMSYMGYDLIKGKYIWRNKDQM